METYNIITAEGKNIQSNENNIKKPSTMTMKNKKFNLA